MSKVGDNGLQASLSWLPAAMGQLPPNAVAAGNDLYIVRARTGADVTPGKLKVGSHQFASFPYNGTEMHIASYEVLCHTGLEVFGKEYEWKQMGNGAVPANGVVGGCTVKNIPLYIARARIHNELCVGKVFQPKGAAYMPYKGKEVRINHYEVLSYR